MSARSMTSVAVLLRNAQWRISVVSLFCVGVLMSAVGLFVLREYEARSMELVARSLAFAGEPALRFNDRQAMRELIDQVAAAAQVAEVTIDKKNVRGWLHYQLPQEGSQDGPARFIERKLIGDPASASIGSGVVLGELSLRSNGKTLMLYLQWASCAIGLSALLTVVVVHAYSRRLAASIVKPINRLAGLTRQVRKSRSFQRRAAPTSVLEIDALGDDFNALLSELQSQQSAIEANHHDLWRANESLRKLSRHDPLTDLPNRAYLSEHLDAIIRRCSAQHEQAGLIFIDTDRFKEVNDRYGHGAGDALLVELSKRLRQSVRDSDFVSRLGGDEFVIVIDPIGDKTEISRLTDRIRQNLDRRVQLPGAELKYISVTMGVAIFPDHASTAIGLLAAADQAMYRAKALGRGSVGTFKPVGDATANDLT